MPARDAVHSLAAFSARRRKPLAFPYAALPPLFIAGDAIVILASAILVELMHHSLLYDAPGDLQMALGMGLVTAVFFVAAMHARRYYGGLRAMPLRRHAKAALMSWTLAFAGLSWLIVLFKMGEVTSRGVLIEFFICGAVGLLAWRIVVKRLYRHLVVAGTVAGPRVAVLAEHGRADINQVLQRLERSGYSVSRLFFIPNQSDAQPDVAPGRQSSAVRTRKTLEGVVRHVREQPVDEILIIGSFEGIAEPGPVLSALRLVRTPVKLIADGALSQALSYRSCEVGAARGIVLKAAALSRFQRLGKRLFDIAVSAVMLAALSPVLLVTALAIRLDSPGPVFFRQWRGGYDGRRFRIFKFRTMRVLEDDAVVRQARKEDPRVTRIGRMLRKTSLDELPQLINVLLGDMSLVGPRPHAIAHDLAYGELIGPYPARHNVKPGITGLAQVNGCRGETEELSQMKRRVEHDLSYIEQWSLSLDLAILVRTVREVIVPRNAY